jgi:hypothetical protein
MVEAVSSLKPFTTVQYTTKDGEHISATKNNGIVTLVGDKNGTRQMPLEDFMKNELVNNVKPLERTPEKDTVEISKPVEAKADVAKADAPKTDAPKADAPAPKEAKKLDLVA